MVEEIMMFDQFAAAHGLILDGIEIGKWVRTKTVSHPNKKNGAYKFLGDVGWVQDHATMSEPATWFADKENRMRIDHDQIIRHRDKAEKEQREGRERAAKKAGWILHKCKIEQHSYLDSKGFREDKGLVWWRSDKDNQLIIPMRINSKLVGAQCIDRNGDKRFLFGQQTSGAEYVIDNKGRDFYCEGYATALSLRLVLRALKLRYRIHVTFSAHNLTRLAKGVREAIVIADNDPNGVGEKAAIDSGCKYWISEVIGEDMNDAHRRLGVFRLSQNMRRFLMAV